jgi:hypothetical protein
MDDNNKIKENQYKSQPEVLLNFITNLLEKAQNRGVFINVALSCLCFVFLGLSGLLPVAEILKYIIQGFSILGIVYGIAASFRIGHKLGKVRYIPRSTRRQLPPQTDKKIDMEEKHDP